MEVTMTFLMITDCFWRKRRHDSHVSKIAWKPFKFNLYLLTQIKLSSLKKLQRSGRNGIWDVYAENDPENVIVKVLETQFHVFTLKNFRNYAGIMLHPLWLKQYTHDYDGIIYLSLSVTVQRFQLRSFSLFCLSQTVLDLENFLDLKTEKPVSKCFQIYSLTSHYQYYNFRPKHNTLAMLNGLFIENGWETPSSRSLECFSALNIWENRPDGCISSPLRIAWLMSLGY